eukprot:CAMPEP_0116124424 /NCGR_PEP_ID=MMETSP0329-20121206/5273_1 /TAXON_ID=697910 /ORGANISM="Pseudo-nitzschia arenysensis, Strain B593" /LENGTH=441 /DNA_ID=CAMNT_0003618403 /DNA_START=117 /DNA_END=1444 /DNA_ORIENTATION=+
MASLLGIAEIQRHLITYLSVKEFVGLQSVSKGFRDPINHETCWKILSERDLAVEDKKAPEYNPHTKSFDALSEQKNYKELYKQWSEWQQQTCYAIEPRHMIQSIEIGRAAILKELGQTEILNSLTPPPSREFFEDAAGDLPSSLIAFYAIHAGQANLTPRSADSEFFAGLFGAYSCYNSFYSMRVIHVVESANAWRSPDTVVLGMNLGNPRTFLVLDYNKNEGPEGSVYFGYQSINRHLVGRGGILSYFEKDKIYQPAIIHPDSPSSLGISLFPATGDMVGVAVTNGVEVTAMPDGTHGGMNFGYNICIRLSPDDSNQGPRSCQLVDRNWEFHYENGTINRVQGEGVIGKQPLLFRQNDGTTGFIDMGPAGTGATHRNATFSYQSQSGPVPGTTTHEVTQTTRAFARGTFSFRPGTINSPQGPLFTVTVAEFPLRVTLPFY